MKYQNIRCEIVVVLGSFREDLDGVFPQFMNGQYLGGQTRMDAAVALSLQNEWIEFIAVGGYDSGTDDSSEVHDMCEFLENSCQSRKITPIKSLPCTFHNLVAVFNTWRLDRESWHHLKNARIGLLTNFYHLPRALKLAADLQHGPFTDLPVPPLVPLCAESLVESIHAWDDAKNIDRLLKRISTEIEALRRIEGGDIQDGCLSECLQDYQSIIRRYSELLLTPDERRLLDMNNH